MSNIVKGVHVAPDGNRTDVAIPTDGLIQFFKKQLGGYPEYAHYGTPESAVCVVVHETSMIDGHAANVLATKVVERLVQRPLSYYLCGSVVLIGYEPRTDTLLNISEDQQSILQALAQDEEVRAWQAYMAGMTASPTVRQGGGRNA